MRDRLSTQLREIVAAPPPVAPPPTPEARRVARALRMEGERAPKGRSARLLEGVDPLAAVLEGRDAEAVARQVARRFAAEPGWHVDVTRDRYGATVALRALVEETQP